MEQLIGIFLNSLIYFVFLALAALWFILPLWGARTIFRYIYHDEYRQRKKKDALEQAEYRPSRFDPNADYQISDDGELERIEALTQTQQERAQHP